MQNPPPQSSPIIAGLALVGIGLLIRQWQPQALELPNTEGRTSRDRGLRRVARKSRDGLARVLPGNLTGSIARSLLVMGAGLILVRALDELVEDEDALF